MASINVSVEKPNLTLRNIVSYPAKKHYETAASFSRGLKEKSGKEEAAIVRKAADNGLAEAQVMYAGYGMLRMPYYDLSEKEIHHWILEAARQGNVLAQFKLGTLCMEKDEKQALLWFRKAAQSHHSKSAFTYGFLLAFGEETTHNYTEAEKWLTFAEMANEIDPNIFDKEEKELLRAALQRLREIN